MTPRQTPFPVLPGEPVQIPYGAAIRFVQVFGDFCTAADLAPKLTCWPADVVAEMLTALGHDDAARIWMECHAACDYDPEDQHYDASLHGAS